MVCEIDIFKSVRKTFGKHLIELKSKIKSKLKIEMYKCAHEPDYFKWINSD